MVEIGCSVNGLQLFCICCPYSRLLIIAGRLMNNQTIVNVALDLVDACWNTYAGDA